MSFVRIEHNVSGTVIYDGPEPFPGTIEQVTDCLIDMIYCGDLRRSRANGHIPSGCGDYRTETRRTEEYEPGSCWEALDWYGVI